MNPTTSSCLLFLRSISTLSFKWQLGLWQLYVLYRFCSINFMWICHPSHSVTSMELASHYEASMIRILQLSISTFTNMPICWNLTYLASHFAKKRYILNLLTWYQKRNGVEVLCYKPEGCGFETQANLRLPGDEIARSPTFENEIGQLYKCTICICCPQTLYAVWYNNPTWAAEPWKKMNTFRSEWYSLMEYTVCKCILSHVPCHHS
jgi:hypothetical protein